VRQRWFNELLHEAASLRAVTSRGRANARMVKRRSSPFPSHDPTKRPGSRPDFTPAMLKPRPISKWQKFAIFN